VVVPVVMVVVVSIVMTRARIGATHDSACARPAVLGVINMCGLG
jgi:hypothetical protein